MKTIHKLGDLGDTILKSETGEFSYDLGTGRDKTELIVTYIDGDTRISGRVSENPRIRLYEEDGLTMDIKDPSDKGNNYERLKPLTAVFREPEHAPNERGDLEIYLEGNRMLAISQFQRNGE